VSKGYKVWLALGVCGAWADLTAQGERAAIAYNSTQINCARFLETAGSDIQTQTSGRIREQTAGRAGVWQFRARPVVGAVELEGWLDSLALWRRSKESTIRPDTDGLLGGRYRGTLSSTGVYASQARPFVPDEVAEVAGMATALDDFFPPLPPRPLQPGEAWRDSSSVTLRRLADSGLSGVPLYRFELEVQRETRGAPVAGDTTVLPLRQVSREHGTFVWHPFLGLLRRDRRIVVTTNVPAGRRVPQSVQSRVEQRVTLVRDLSVPPEVEGRCPSGSASGVR
jgi:hypothetical protein